jgi:hypothetical protein
MEWIQYDIEVLLSEVTNKMNVLITQSMCEFIHDKIEEAIEQQKEDSVYYKISLMEPAIQKNMPFYNLFLKILSHFEEGLRCKYEQNISIFSKVMKSRILKLKSVLSWR